MEEIHDFDSKNEAGLKLERQVIEDIRKKRYPLIYKYEPNNGDYDAFIGDIDEGIEIKNDLEGAFTDNICIEYKQDGRLSGISITKAKYWIHYDQTYLYLALTEEIKNLIRSFLIYHIDLEMMNRKLGESDVSAEEVKSAQNKFYGDSKEKYGEMYQDIYRGDAIGHLPEKRLNQGSYYKYMGLYLIPKEIFKKYCLEVDSIENMRYEKIV